MKKKILVVLVLALSLALSGCGKNDKSAENKQVTLDILAYGDSSTREGDDWNRIVAEFEALYPNVTVENEVLSDMVYAQKVETRLAAGEVPDIAYIWADSIGQVWVDANQLFDHRSFLDPEFYDMDLIPAMGPEGEIWQIPMGLSNMTSILYVNTELLEELGLEIPATYEEMAAMVPVARAANKEVLAFAGADGWVWGSCFLSTVIGRYGGDVHWVRKAMAGENHFTDEAFVKSLDFIKRLREDKIFTTSTVLTDYGSALSGFINGNALFMLDGQWRTSGIEDPDFAKKVDLIPFPALPGEDPKMAGSVAAAISVGYGITKKGASNPATLEAAINFLKFFHSPKATARRLNDGTIVAPILKNFELPESLPYLGKVKIDLAGNTSLISDVLDAYLPGEVNNALNTGMQNITIGQATAEEIAKEIETLVRQN